VRRTVPSPARGLGRSSSRCSLKLAGGGSCRWAAAWWQRRSSSRGADVRLRAPHIRPEIVKSGVRVERRPFDRSDLGDTDHVGTPSRDGLGTRGGRSILVRCSVLVQETTVPVRSNHQHEVVVGVEHPVSGGTVTDL